MKHVPHFEIRRTGGQEQAESSSLALLLADLHRAVHYMDIHITAEQDPMVARAMVTRRDNLAATIAALQQQASRR